MANVPQIVLWGVKMSNVQTILKTDRKIKK